MKYSSFMAIILAAGLICSCSEKKPQQQGARPQNDPAEVLGKGTDYELRRVEKTELSDGVTYKKYELKSTDKVHLLEIDMTKEGIDVETFYANDICPNPHYETTNNGKKIREVLSEICIRKRAEGYNVLAGINGEYYETQCGILLSFHVEDGEIVFIPDPYTVSIHQTFTNGLVVFKDGSLSTDARTISCKARWSGKEIPFYSVNDTIVRLSPKARSGSVPYQGANLYNYRYKKVPFASNPDLINPIGTKALFLVCKSDSKLNVNEGWISGVVTEVVDGRDGKLAEAPYVNGKDQWVLQLTGESATAYAGAKAGDEISLRMDISIGGITKPIKSHIGGIFRLVHENEYVEVPPSRTSEKKRATILGTDISGKVLKLLCIDTSKFLYKDHAEVCKLLGLYDAIKTDGGGSAEMWTWDNRKGIIQCPSTDSRGPERSNMNYLLVCRK